MSQSVTIQVSLQPCEQVATELSTVCDKVATSLPQPVHIVVTTLLQLGDNVVSQGCSNHATTLYFLYGIANESDLREQRRLVVIPVGGGGGSVF